MTREQFLALAGQLYDAQQGGASRGNGTPPKWDTALPAGQGEVVYASECSAKELQYQLVKAQKPPSDPKYADANAKRAKALGYWLSYRQSNPDECWTGERNKERITAAPPSDRPAKYPRVSSGGSSSGYHTTTYDDAGKATTTDPAGPGAGDDSDIPFAPLGDVG